MRMFTIWTNVLLHGQVPASCNFLKAVADLVPRIQKVRLPAHLPLLRLPLPLLTPPGRG